MPGHLSIPACSLVFLLLLDFFWSEAACSPRGGMNIWQQPRTSPIITDQPFLHGTFPSGFLWGSGTSAFQTEGAWNQDGKGTSIWDFFTHSSMGGKSNGDTADVASNSYNCWEEDVYSLDYLGVRAYTFSLSWPRLFPDGNAAGKPNAAAVEHYSSLIDKLLEKRIQPIVTLYHSDLPQVLQEQYGGWKNETLVELFEGYARFCFHTFGSRVKHWLTMHNPYLVAVQGYGTGKHAPGEKGGLSGSLIVAHNLIRAHARAWHIYDSHFRATQKGKVSIVLGSHWVEPQRGEATTANVELCQQSIEAVLGWFANPIFGGGSYPDSLRKKYGHLLPLFTPEEKLCVKKSADFFALSFGPNNLRMGRDLIDHGQTVTPDLRRLLSWIKLEYGDQRVLVAEAGWFSEASVGREDTVAIYLMKNFINQVLQAVERDGVQVFGYVAWSLVDGFEWNYGYSIRRGLFHVNFSQPGCTRTPKTSAQYYRQVVGDNGFLRDEPSTEVKGHFPCNFQWGIADSTLQVHFHPYSPQFNDPQLYRWNLTGDGSLHPVPGVKLQTRPAQCTDYLAIPTHLRMLASTGASHYRFALNWTLILPKGDRSLVNTEALRYYRCVLMELQKLGLETMVIMYYPTHRAPNLGLPAALHDSGGWLQYTTVEAFQQYAELCYQEFGKWVRHWLTINEPNRLIDAYPSGIDRHQAAHNLILAHAKAWRLHEREYNQQQQSQVSLALHADWAQPANPFLESHEAAVERFLLFEIGRFLDPLLGTQHGEEQIIGDYPHEMKMYLAESARLIGLPGSPLPNFTDSEREELRGALSFIALNHFTTRLVSPQPKTQRNPSPDHGCLTLSDPTWPSSSMGQAVVPWGLRKMLRWVSQRYGRKLPIIITGSGIDDAAPVEDVLRQQYLRSYLQEGLKAYLNGVNLQGFYMWRLQDRHGPQYGLFTAARLQSKPKASVAAYKDIIVHSGLPNNATERPCSSSELHKSCLTCKWIFKNKALLVFGGCLLITAGMLAALVVYFIVARRNRKQDRGRRKCRVNQRRKKRGAPMLFCPTAKY